MRTAVSDLTAPLADHDIDTTIDLPADPRFEPDVEALLFRATQIGVRNVVTHVRGAQCAAMTITRFSMCGTTGSASTRISRKPDRTAMSVCVCCGMWWEKPVGD